MAALKRSMLSILEPRSSSLSMYVKPGGPKPRGSAAVFLHNYYQALGAYSYCKSVLRVMSFLYVIRTFYYNAIIRLSPSCQGVDPYLRDTIYMDIFQIRVVKTTL